MSKIIYGFAALILTMLTIAEAVPGLKEHLPIGGSLFYEIGVIVGPAIVLDQLIDWLHTVRDERRKRRTRKTRTSRRLRSDSPDSRQTPNKELHEEAEAEEAAQQTEKPAADAASATAETGDSLPERSPGD